MTDLFMIGLILFEAIILYMVLRSELYNRKMRAEIEQLYDTTARMSKVIAEHSESITLLGINGDEPDIEEDKKEIEETQKELDNKYNEGMDNIFGYTVNTGINLNRGN